MYRYLYENRSLFYENRSLIMYIGSRKENYINMQLNLYIFVLILYTYTVEIDNFMCSSLCKFVYELGVVGDVSLWYE